MRAGIFAIGLALAIGMTEAPPAHAQTTAVPSAAVSSIWTPPQRRRIILMRHGDVAYFDAAGKPVPDPDKVVLSDKG